MTTGQDLPDVATGLDVLVSEFFIPVQGRRVGAICNPASVDHRMRHLADLLAEAADVDLVALFGPEHGVRGDAQDMVSVASSLDPRIGVPVHSLYGSDPTSLAPTAEQLGGLDLLIFDLQDVGSRYDTFVATMLYAMQAAAARGIEFVVLDRPNPIGGEEVEGPTVREGFESFVGAYPLPIRHGMTVGELARMFRAELALDLELRVVPCQGWRRSMFWPDTGLSWVAPSPNMPAPGTALVYPGAGLVEGTNLSEGRGTTRPFELWGAPWLDPHALAERAAWELNRHSRGQGVYLRPCAFRPAFHKYAGELCFGVQVHVADPTRFAPAAVYTCLLALAREQAPDRFAWRTEPYEFVRDPMAIDLLYGSAREREIIEAGGSFHDLYQLFDGVWSAEEARFRERRATFLLYR